MAHAVKASRRMWVLFERPPGGRFLPVRGYRAWSRGSFLGGVISDQSTVESVYQGDTVTDTIPIRLVKN